MPSQESNQVDSRIEKQVTVSNFEVVTRPDGIVDEWGDGDAEKLAREGAELLEQGAIDVERLVGGEN